MTFSCPHCQQPLEISAEWAGHDVACPNCGQPFVVPTAEGEIAPEAEAPSAPSTPPDPEEQPAPVLEHIPPPAPPDQPAGVRPDTETTPAPPPRTPRDSRSRSAPTVRGRPAPTRKKGGSQSGKFLLALLLLAAAGLGYAKYRYGQSPTQVWQSLAAYVRGSNETPAPPPATTPSSSLAPTPAPAPAETPLPAATAAATPTLATTPAPDPLAWIAQHRERWPREVQLLEPVEFPAVYDGKVVGTTLAPAGGSVGIVEITGAQTRVRYANAEKSVPTAATTLPRYAAAEMARPTPARAPTLAASALPTPTSSAPPEDPSAAEEAPPTPGSPPRVYVGSAYRPAITDMATKPDEWKTVRANAGYHEHPVGWHPTYAMMGLGREILSAYKNRYFTAEEDIGGLSRGSGGTHWAETVITEGRKYGQSWQCVALTVNFHTDQLTADPAKAAEDLKEYCKNAGGLRIPYYLLFSPVSPEAVKVFDETGKPFENLPIWVWVAQHAGAAGVAIDCPAPFLSNPRWRARATDIYRTTHQAHLKFIWIFNGGTDAGVTERAAQTIRGVGVRPDYWIVSHFHDREYPGTPEDKSNTVTSQARVLINGKY